MFSILYVLTPHYSYHSYYSYYSHFHSFFSLLNLDIRATEFTKLINSTFFKERVNHNALPKKNYIKEPYWKRNTQYTAQCLLEQITILQTNIAKFIFY